MEWNKWKEYANTCVISKQIQRFTKGKGLEVTITVWWRQESYEHNRQGHEHGQYQRNMSKRRDFIIKSTLEDKGIFKEEGMLQLPSFRFSKVAVS